MSFRSAMRYNWYHCRCEHEITSFISGFCRSGILAYSEGYAIILGIVGSVMCANDIRKIIDMGCNLPCHLHRVRKYLWSSLTNHQYRDMKLAATAFSFEYYLMLVFGSIIGSEVFLVPWLIFDAFYLIFEFATTILSIIYGDHVISKPKHFLISMFMIYNWLAIFCASLNMSGSCHD
ncbi:uncharacterized protein [Atheta coriaria]|uniref:uncharacterized protein n=1 Tax=Dalotia coriaria TaxID=877792 RepID=UPI0031F353CF